MNENNGYNGQGEKNYRQQAKINTNNLTNEEFKIKKKKKDKNNLPKLLNDGSKEAQEQDGYSKSSSDKID